MNNLVDDLLELIFTRCDAGALIRLSACCRRYNTIITKSTRIQLILAQHLYHQPSTSSSVPVQVHPEAAHKELEKLLYKENHLIKLNPRITTFDYSHVMIVADAYKDVVVSIPFVNHSFTPFQVKDKWLLCMITTDNGKHHRFVYTSFKPTPACCWPKISIEEDVILITEDEGDSGIRKFHVLHLLDKSEDGTNLAKPYKAPILHVHHGDPRGYQDTGTELKGDFLIVPITGGFKIYNWRKDVLVADIPLTQRDENHIPRLDWAGPTLLVCLVKRKDSFFLTVYNFRKITKDRTLARGKSKPPIPTLILRLPHEARNDLPGYLRDDLPPFRKVSEIPKRADITFWDESYDILTNSLEETGLIVLHWMDNIQFSKKVSILIGVPFQSLHRLLSEEYKTLTRNHYKSRVWQKTFGIGIDNSDATIPILDFDQWSHEVFMWSADGARDVYSSHSVRARGLRFVQSDATVHANIRITVHDFNERVLGFGSQGTVHHPLGGSLEGKVKFSESTDIPESNTTYERVKYRKTVHHQTHEHIGCMTYTTEFKLTIPQEEDEDEDKEKDDEQSELALVPDMGPDPFESLAWETESDTSDDASSTFSPSLIDAFDRDPSNPPPVSQEIFDGDNLILCRRAECIHRFEFSWNVGQEEKQG